MYYGGDYNPEQWPESVWDEDVELMRSAGVNLVTVNVFSWSLLQPEEGVFDWSGLDRILDLLHRNGIAVDLATSTASPPPWVTESYPGVLPQDENGATYWPGSRQHYAPTSPDYRRLASELVRALAERYVAHPAVIMWHVNNELGCHVPWDYSDSAAVAFRVWLEEKYSDIDALNDAWTTTFWSQRYSSFSQIVPPRKSPSFLNPSSVLDFRRFSSDALLALYTMERDILRAAGATQPITTNLMGAFVPADYRRWAAEMDFISTDSYPDPNDPEAFRAMAFSYDLIRGLKPDTPWVLMEQATNAVQWRRTNARKSPGMMAAWSMQAVSRGADGVLFFQWRQSRGGAEKFHSAMLPHSGADSRVFTEIVGLGADLAALPELGWGSRARVALVFDWDSLWASSGPGQLTTLDYGHLVQRWHAALHRQGIGVDVVGSADALGAYDVVIAPHLSLLTDASAANLRDFVRDGGHLLVAAMTDVVDEHDRIRAGGYLQGLKDALGIGVEEYDALVPPADPGPGVRAVHLEFEGARFSGEWVIDEIDPRDAQVVSRFVDGPLDGRAAITTHAYGDGVGCYVATVPDDEGMLAITRWFTGLAGVRPELPELPAGVEASRRGDRLLIINHSSEAAVVPTGSASDAVELAPFEWRWLSSPA